MNTAEASAMRREILDELAGILRDDLAAEDWGRLLVEVVRGPHGDPRVASIDVDELVGDEARVDQVFGGAGIRAVLPALAKAVEALCALDDLDIDDVGGGTFVRMPDDRFGWLPALVRAPSRRLDGERDDLVARLEAKNAAFHEIFGRSGRERMEFDLGAESAAWSVASRRPMRARATLIGTFAPRARTWGWGSSNPHAPTIVRGHSAALVDAIEERDLWELSTPVFATDELMAWAIAAFVLDRAKGDAVICLPEKEGLVFVLLRQAR